MLAVDAVSWPQSKWKINPKSISTEITRIKKLYFLIYLIPFYYLINSFCQKKCDNNQRKIKFDMEMIFIGLICEWSFIFLVVTTNLMYKRTQKGNATYYFSLERAGAFLKNIFVKESSSFIWDRMGFMYKPEDIFTFRLEHWTFWPQLCL